ncbi:MAG: CHAT domain-containing protein [Leptolyngbyaceae cyanobacterium SL_7_1]|nr:CHAT domain-containing protein [Leptolyngbyaceae cyanobacterium SL_7_1]
MVTGIFRAVGTNFGLAAASSGRDAEQFLRETLQLVAENQGNPQQIYPLWAQQRARFNEELLVVLPQVAAQLLAGSAEQRSFVAAVLGEFGNLINQFPLGTRWLNLELGIASYQQALTVMTQDAMPVEWATTMMNLANAYKNRIRGDRAENIEQAIGSYQSSLGIFMPELFPDDCRKVARSLANLYSQQQRWGKAVPVYQTALQAAEILYQSANLLDGKASELAETADLPRRAAYALARIGNLEEAVETVEQGRARGLSETLKRDRADLEQLQETHAYLFNQYQEITAQLRNLETQDRMRMTSEERQSLTPEAHRTLAIDLRQQFKTLLQEIRQVPDYETFLALPTFAEVRRALRRDRPLVYLLSTPAGSLALIVTTNSTEPLWLNDFPESKLREILYGPAEDPELGGWFGAYQNFRNNSKANYQAWCEEIERSTQQLWEPLMFPLIQHLKAQNLQQATLIPTGLLSFLPLHAAWVETSTRRRYALDEICFTYAPNARSLTAAEAIAQQTATDSILAIDNPLQDLPNSSREVEAAIATFPQSKVLKHTEATVEAALSALPSCNVLHFSCHGTANLNKPLASGLAMSNGSLTLQNLLDLKLTEEDRTGIRLAILSACETGLTGIKNVDEAIGLPTGLLQAGVAGVVASLWSVSDLSTMMLLSRFYDFWRIEGYDPIEALRQAQQWVRDTTNSEKTTYFKNFMPDQSSNKMPDSTADYLYKSRILSRPDARDFAHPFHWEAFSYTGV